MKTDERAGDTAVIKADLDRTGGYRGYCPITDRALGVSASH